jgi:adenylate cyclase
MWLYLAAHMVNHCLGLWSLALAERGLRAAVAVVHFMPITVVLYGAFSLHLVLALAGIWQRPSLKMPWSEVLRIALGLGFPLLLIGHVFATRVSYEWFQLPPEYGRVVTGLIASGSEGRQLALLAPGWIHGCLGLDLSLRRRRQFQVWRRLFWVLAVVLPLCAAAGFLAMEREVSSLLGDPQWLDRLTLKLAVEHRDLVRSRRDLLVDAYLVLVLTVIAVRGLMLYRARVK